MVKNILPVLSIAFLLLPSFSSLKPELLSYTYRLKTTQKVLKGVDAKICQLFCPKSAHFCLKLAQKHAFSPQISSKV